MGDEGGRALAEALKQNSGLTSLFISVRLGSGLLTNKQLTCLLQHNGIAALGAYLADTLQHNSTLTELELKVSSQPEEAAVLLLLRFMNLVLTRLTQGNGIGNAGAEALAAALRHNKSLTVLCLGVSLELWVCRPHNSLTINVDEWHWREWYPGIGQRTTAQQKSYEI